MLASATSSSEHRFGMLANADVMLRKPGLPQLLTAGYLDVSGLANEQLSFGAGVLDGMDGMSIELTLAIVDGAGLLITRSDATVIHVTD